MSFTLIREERITHTGDGLQLDDDLYIKLDAAFDDLIVHLRGKELPALLHIQLREAYASSGRGDPATLKTIRRAAGGADGDCSERQAQRIVKSLLAKTLIADAGMSPRTGEKFYRPLGYAWFGNRRATGGVTSMSPQNNGSGAGRSMSPPMSPNVTPVAKCHPPDTVVVVDVQTNNSILGQTTTQTRAILKACGIFGKAQERLAENVAPETAQAWQEWLAHAPKNLHTPTGVMINALLADPAARPTLPAKKEPETRVRKPLIQGPLAHVSDEDAE